VRMIKELAYRIFILALISMAVALFGYNQVAQARAVRFRPLDEFRYINTWTGQYCRFSGGCSKLGRSRTSELRSAPIDTVDTTP
jgi:hypothetical protein